MLHIFRRFIKTANIAKFTDNNSTKNRTNTRTTIINFSKYPTITFAMSKIMEMSKEEQNQVALYLFNDAYSINNRFN